jgi:hypothetical protein
MNNYFDDFILPPYYITQPPVLFINQRELMTIRLPYDSTKSAAKLCYLIRIEYFYKQYDSYESKGDRKESHHVEFVTFRRKQNYVYTSAMYRETERLHTIYKE